MSAIRNYVFANGTLARASKAAALAVLELAQSGYVILTMPKRLEDSVEVTRTKKSAGALQEEQRLLLKAIFGKVNAEGKVVVFDRSLSLPVAQTLAEVAREYLEREGLIQELRPQTVIRRLLRAYLIAMPLVVVLVMASSWHGMTAFYAVCGILGSWLLFNFSILPLQAKAVFRTLPGEELFNSNQVRKAIQYPTKNPAVYSDSTWLTYVWLWSGPLLRGYLINGGSHMSKPAWCKGEWPDTLDLLVQSLSHLEFRLSSVLGQVAAGKHRYSVNSDVVGEHALTGAPGGLIREWGGRTGHVCGDGDSSG